MGVLDIYGFEIFEVSASRSMSQFPYLLEHNIPIIRVYISQLL